MGLTPQVLLLLAVGVFTVTASELVPVYMWQTIPTKGFLPAVSHVNEDTFKEILHEKQVHQHSDRMLIFAEQSLSPEDFSAQTFYELRQVADHTRVTYLPTVASPMDVIQSLAKEIQRVSVDDIIKNPTLLESKQLIIDLDDAKDDEDRVEMLKRHSKFISEVYEKVSASSRDNVLAVYTGRHSSWIVPSEIVKHRQTRATTESTGTIKTTQNYLVFYNGTFLYTAGDKKSKSLTITDVIETPTGKNGTLTFKTNDGDVVMTYNIDDFDYWIVPVITYNSHRYMVNFNAPLNFSWSCSSNVSMRSLKNDEKDLEEFLQFPTLYQLQYFPDGANSNSSFYDSYDCVGFTSPAIWSGLFVTFILAMILVFGLTMIMDIKTMDRFDDPKGKTITINAGE